MWSVAGKPKLLPEAEVPVEGIVEWRAEPGEPIERCIRGEGGSAEIAVGNQPICRAEAEDVDDRQHDGYQGEPNEKEEVGAIVGHGD